MSNFELAQKVRHLIVQPADQRQNPPESYLFVQDGLIISCGVLYAFCYIFCMIRTYSDKTYPGARWGSIQFLCLTMAYELFYAFTTTSTRFEKLAFLAWFELDLSFVIVALRKAHTPGERRVLRRNMILGCLAGIAFLWMLTRRYPDEREQVTAYWTGIILQLPIGWICLYQLWKDQSTKGHSLEIWLTRYLGCFTAYGVFLWRYFNVPQNWAYVWTPWSIGIIIATLIPETIYPFVYVWVHKTQKDKRA
ncbi:hypothetical protein CNMCM8927_002885 [Aspergillus lentulus]|uniref:Integral membrane protein n=1 Tax=Aspergillus lentulus TaxID=293939 RepID=A0AAN6BSL1_ASPLE|nr:hypothetical protein CNMCM6069_001278 [Aspergillus lentulus]KAF4178581.1 hypothetical protein CNMCM8060_004303 [Aspergillus lentulus]KAF4196901.1 hypothetical protein CNMCM8694_004161 [Aspergillus lentulus]KAF4207480.1 hypothetical protein CNMCM8927_002885 [Aspergillus lentulus]